MICIKNRQNLITRFEANKNHTFTYFTAAIRIVLFYSLSYHSEVETGAVGFLDKETVRARKNIHPIDLNSI